MNRVMTAAQHLFDHHGTGYDRLTRIVFGGVHARIVADVAEAAPSDGRVLDVGCGPGRLAVMLARRRPDLTIEAVDISPDMVAVARRRVTEAGVADRVTVEPADVADLPYPDGSIDLIVSTASFHHWANVPGAARELARVVRPGGRVQIYDFKLAPWRRLATALDRPVPRTSVSLLFTRADVPV